MPALLKRVGLPVKYTDNAKVTGRKASAKWRIVEFALFTFYFLYRAGGAIVTYSLRGEPSSSTCDARNFIGYVDENDFAEYIVRTTLQYVLSEKTGQASGVIFIPSKAVYNCSGGLHNLIKSR